MPYCHIELNSKQKLMRMVFYNRCYGNAICFSIYISLLLKAVFVKNRVNLFHSRSYKKRAHR